MTLVRGTRGCASPFLLVPAMAEVVEAVTGQGPFPGLSPTRIFWPPRQGSIVREQLHTRTPILLCSMLSHCFGTLFSRVQPCVSFASLHEKLKGRAEPIKQKRRMPERRGITRAVSPKKMREKRKCQSQERRIKRPGQRIDGGSRLAIVAALELIDGGARGAVAQGPQFHFGVPSPH